MLLKGCQTLQPGKKGRVNVIKQQRNTGGGTMKLIGVGTVTAPRVQRKVMRVASKRPAPGKRIPVVQAVDPCDSSNDSGLGLEQHQELQLAARSTIRFVDQEPQWANESPDVKRKKMEIKLESDDANDNFTFEETMIQAKRDPMQVQLNLPTPVRPPAVRATPPPRVVGRRPALTTTQRRTVAPTLLANQLLAIARNSKPHLQILTQPEQQHRARYQTEGSRGAVKDRTGNSSPSVKLVGHDGPATLQVFIGSDTGRVVPHMFYQACRVSGKNSTQCTEKVVDGTVVIEMELTSAKGMVAVCDCVGILKERNVDVEHRFPEQSGSRQNKKKSTRCRMVFRTTITHPDGTTETLEISSQPIVCTQPPGVPEICKKSLASGLCTGGQELFILGKNFLKDTQVVFFTPEHQPLWEVTVYPDKEYLQQSHLVCLVPPYRDLELTEPVSVRLVVTSSGKTSESHTFQYTPPLRHPQGNAFLRCDLSYDPFGEVRTSHLNYDPFGEVRTSHLNYASSGHNLVGQKALTSDSSLVDMDFGVSIGNTEEMHNCVTKVLPGMKQSISESINLIRPSALGSILRPFNAQYLLVQSTQGGGKESVFFLKPPSSPEDTKPIIPNVGLKMMPPPAQVSPTLIQPQPSILPPLCPLPSLMPTGSNNQIMKEANPVVLPLSPTDLKGVDLCMKSTAPVATTKPGLVIPSTTAPLCPTENDITTLPIVTSSTDHYVMDNVPVPMATGADLSSTQSPSMATFRRFVSSENNGSPLPSLSVEKFLSGLEDKPEEIVNPLEKTAAKISPGGILQSVLQHKEVFPEKSQLVSDILSKPTVLDNHSSETNVDILDSNITSTSSILFHPQTNISTPLESQSPNMHVIESLRTSQDSILSTCLTNGQIVAESSPMMHMDVSNSLLANCLMGNVHNITSECSTMPALQIHNSVMSNGVTNGLHVPAEVSSVTDMQQTNSILDSCLKNFVNVNPLKIEHHNDVILNSCGPPYNKHDISQEHVMLHCQPATTTTITTANCKQQEIGQDNCDTVTTNHLESSQISATQNARLDALVSSAMDTSNLLPQTNTQKLEELVNTAADCHLNSPQLFDTHTNFISTNQSDDTIIQMTHEIRPQSTPEGMGASSSCSAMTENLMIDTMNGSSSKQVTVNLSPKLNHLGSPLLASNYTASLEQDFSGLNNVSTFVSHIDESAGMCNEGAMLNLPINNMIIGAPVASSTSPLLASSIAVKNMILHSAATTNSYSPSTIAMNNVMLPSQEHLVTSGTVRLDALVNSTLDNHISPVVLPMENKMDVTSGQMHSVEIPPMTCTEHLESLPLPHFTGAPSSNQDGSMNSLLNKSIVDLALVKMETGVAEGGHTANQKREEGMVPRELTQMSEFDLLSYINPSCFDAV